MSSKPLPKFFAGRRPALATCASLVLLAALGAGLAACAAAPLFESGASADAPPEGARPQGAASAPERPGDEPRAEASPTAYEFVASPRPSVALVEQYARFVSLGDELQGVVTRPEAAAPSPGYPAVVLLHRRGPVDADGTTVEEFGIDFALDVAVYAELAEALASRGFVVLRYHKRTCVKGAGLQCPYPASYLTQRVSDMPAALRADALAALDLVRGLEGVDGTNIFVVGHDEGGSLAMDLVGERPVRAVGLLAPNPMPLDELVLWQSQQSILWLEQAALMETDTTMGDILRSQIQDLKQAHAHFQTLFEALREEREPGDMRDLTARAWRDQLAMDARGMRALRESAVPVLALFGELDRYLPPDSARQFEARMQGSRSRPVVMRLGHLSHSMVDLREDADIAVEDQVAGLLAAFFTRHLERREPGALNAASPAP